MSIVTKIIGLLLKLIPVRYFLALWRRVLICRLQVDTPEQALKILMQLDNFVYQQSGKYACQYDNGTHVKHRLTGYTQYFSELATSMDGPYLDLGCGHGHLANEIAKRSSFDVVGVDILPERIAECQKWVRRDNLAFVLGDATQIDVGQRFQTITLSNVLEHIAGRIEFLKSIVEKYQPAQILIRVPNFERDWRVPLKKELNVEWMTDITHETEHTPSELEKELTAAGLEVTHREIRWGEIWVIAKPAVG